MPKEELTLLEVAPSAPAPYDLLLLADPRRELVDQYLAKGMRFEARLDNDVAGIAIVLPLDVLSAELMNIAVAPPHQGQGIGKTLLEHTIAALSASGYERLSVGTGNSSLNQLGFYQKAGFRMVAVIPNHFTDHYPDPIVENGIRCRDMIRLTRALSTPAERGPGAADGPARK